MSDELLADFESHRIYGFTAHGSHRLDVPLISEVLPGLWQGGCIGNVALPEDFDYVLSLYPWEKYRLGENTRRVEITAYDALEVPDLSKAADEAYHEWKGGSKVLIHCQAGLNRSGLVTAQVLFGDGWNMREAIQHMRDKRCGAVLCNPHFEDYLLSL